MEIEINKTEERPRSLLDKYQGAIREIRRLRTGTKVRSILANYSKANTPNVRQDDSHLSVAKNVDGAHIELWHDRDGVSRRFTMEVSGDGLGGVANVTAHLEEFDDAYKYGTEPARIRVYTSYADPRDNTLPFSVVMHELAFADKLATQAARA